MQFPDELKKLKAALLKKDTRIADLESATSVLEGKKEDGQVLEDEVESLEEMINVLDDDNSILWAEVDRQRNKVDSVEKKSAAFEAENAALKNRVAELEGSNERLEKQYEAEWKKASALREAVQMGLGKLNEIEEAED